MVITGQACQNVPTKVFVPPLFGPFSKVERDDILGLP